MELTPEMIELLKADLSKAKTYEDLMGAMEQLRSFLQALLKQCLKQNWLNILATINIPL